MTYSFPNIEHIVLSGAAHGFFTYLGVFDVLFNHKYIELKKIKSIHGTSAGSILAVILLLDIELNIVIDYFLERLWQEVFVFEDNLLKIINENGLWNIELIKKLFSPLFSLKEISIDISLENFYKLTNTEIFIYATDLKTFDKVVFSHNTHPNMKLIDAIYMSCSLPFLFIPMCYNNKYYIDGGFSANYPIDSLLENIENTDSIFGVKCMGDCLKNKEPENNTNEETIKNINFFELIQYLIFNPIFKITTTNLFEHKIKNEIYIYSCGGLNIDVIKSISNSYEERLKLIDGGREEANEFLNEKYIISSKKI